MCMEDMESEMRSRNQCWLAGAENAEANAPPVPRPLNTSLERAIFHILRRWRWIAGTLLVCAASAVIPLLAEAALYRGDGLEIPRSVRWAVLSLPVIATAAYPFVWQAFRPASNRMIRAAIFAANDDERAILHAFLRDALKSGGAGQPIQREHLFRLFNQARGLFGAAAQRKQKHMNSLRSQQWEMIKGGGSGKSANLS